MDILPMCVSPMGENIGGRVKSFAFANDAPVQRSKIFDFVQARATHGHLKFNNVIFHVVASDIG